LELHCFRSIVADLVDEEQNNYVEKKRKRIETIKPKTKKTKSENTKKSSLSLKTENEDQIIEIVQKKKEDEHSSLISHSQKPKLSHPDEDKNFEYLNVVLKKMDNLTLRQKIMKKETDDNINNPYEETWLDEEIQWQVIGFLVLFNLVLFIYLFIFIFQVFPREISGGKKNKLMWFRELDIGFFFFILEITVFILVMIGFLSI
jgi:Fe2+ transport system protein B